MLCLISICAQWMQRCPCWIPGMERQFIQGPSTERKFLKELFYPHCPDMISEEFFFFFFINYADLSHPDSKPADDKGRNIIMLL